MDIGASDVELAQNLDKVLTSLREAGLTVEREKFSFMQTLLEYLGFVIDEKNGTFQNKNFAINEMLPPSDVSKLRFFFGIIQDPAKFLPNFSKDCAGYYALLRKDSPGMVTGMSATVQNC